MGFLSREKWPQDSQLTHLLRWKYRPLKIRREQNLLANPHLFILFQTFQKSDVCMRDNIKATA